MKRVRVPVLLTINLLIGLVLAICAVIAWQSGWVVLTLLLWLPISFLAHAVFPMGLHEAAHCGLTSSRRLNDLYGILLGTALLTPLSAYRLVHWTHHRSLGSPQDLEWWPYVDPGVPRAVRQASVAAELTLGLLVTPCTILRGVLAANRETLRHRLPRIVAEYLLILLVICFLGTIVAWNGWWQEFLVFYFVPGMIAGNGQSLRKFSEHLGLIGLTETELTRSIEPRLGLERILIYLMLNEAFHAAHHRAPGIAWEYLPEQTARLPSAERGQVYPSYALAVLAMLPSLADPRFGSAWCKVDEQAA